MNTKIPDAGQVASTSNKRGLVIGVANDASIAYGCVRALKEYGCTEIIVSYQNQKSYKYVKHACDLIGITNLVEFNYTDENSIQELFTYVKNQFGTIDFVIHAIAFANQESLHGKVVDCLWEGFAQSIQVSCFSLIACCRHAKALMPNGGAILTMTYIGANVVIPDYGIMGPVKACLESTVRYLASELAPEHIRVFAISPGPIQTRAASGITNFDQLMQKAQLESPMQRLVTIDEVGNLSVFLISEMASGMTGQVIYVDAGYFLKG